jgi:hypothetical protein
MPTGLVRRDDGVEGGNEGASTPVWFHDKAATMRTKQATWAVGEEIDARAIVVVVYRSLRTIVTMRTMISHLLLLFIEILGALGNLRRKAEG